MNTATALVKFLVSIQMLIELIIEKQIEAANEKDRDRLRKAVAAARGARTEEEKRAASQKIEDAFSPDHPTDDN